MKTDKIECSGEIIDCLCKQCIAAKHKVRKLGRTLADGEGSRYYWSEFQSTWIFMHGPEGTN